VSHQSENPTPLEVVRIASNDLATLPDGSDVTLFWLPSDASRQNTRALAERLTAWSERLENHAVVCALTSPETAARLVPLLEGSLHYQLWVAVKTPRRVSPDSLPHQHAALLVFTRSSGVLKHTKTRIGYSYCPACGKTTKDYGGKKHVYHEYGTLMSDVWRDLEIEPERGITLVVDRLRDLFSLEPHRTLQVIDLHELDLGHETPLTVTIRDDLSTILESQLINGDSLEVLATLPENSVDFVFADPPYNLDKRYDRWDDALEARQYIEWCNQWLTALERVLKPGGTLAVLNIPQLAARHFAHLDTFMRFQSWIAWEGLSLPVRFIMPAHYGIACFSKGEPRPLPGTLESHPSLQPLEEWYCLRSTCVAKRNQSRITDRGILSDLWWDIHRLKHNTYRVDHPCQLPPLLMERLIGLFTHPGEIVLDPFNGAGTTTLVAAQMNRRYIGIELSEKYHAITLERHVGLERGINPFDKGKSTPKSKNSRVKRLDQRGSVTKKELQLEVKRIAIELGRLPTREDVATMGRYSLKLYDASFLSWAEACAAARTTGMSETRIERTTTRDLSGTQTSFFDI
jgi:site-specific DNA-methyltransferase (adenine-specific)